VTTVKRTSHRQPSLTAAIQTKETLRGMAQVALTSAQYEAYRRGMEDAQNPTRNHPPYGFSDLQQAWRLGWLAGKQKAEGLNGGSLQGNGSVVRVR
jgi:hypothetical protein